MSGMSCATSTADPDPGGIRYEDGRPYDARAQDVQIGLGVYAVD